MLVRSASSPMGDKPAMGPMLANIKSDAFAWLLPLFIRKCEPSITRQRLERRLWFIKIGMRHFNVTLKR